MTPGALPAPVPAREEHPLVAWLKDHAVAIVSGLVGAFVASLVFVGGAAMATGRYIERLEAVESEAAANGVQTSALDKSINRQDRNLARICQQLEIHDCEKP